MPSAKDTGATALPTDETTELPGNNSLVDDREHVPPKPDWETYRYMDKVPLWMAIALSCDMNPEGFCDEYGTFPRDDIDPAELPAEFLRRAQVATSNLGEALPIAVGAAEREAGKRWLTDVVRMSEFARWARSMKWLLPDDLSWQIEKKPGAPLATESDDKNIDDRVQRTLYLIIRALAIAANLSLSERGAAVKVAKLTQTGGFQVDEKTVRNHIREMQQQGLVKPST